MRLASPGGCTRTYYSVWLSSFWVQHPSFSSAPAKAKILLWSRKNRTESLEGEPEVALVLLFGAVGEGEKPEVGAARASDLWPRLISSMPEIFSERALMRPLNSRYLARGQYSAEIYFQYFDDAVGG